MKMKKILFAAIPVLVFLTTLTAAYGKEICVHDSRMISRFFKSTEMLGDTNIQERANWMKKAHWGIMVHYLADWCVHTDHVTMNLDEWNRLVDQVNVEKLASQIDSVGAGYLIFTIGQNSGYYDAPNKIYEHLTGITDKCSKRDLISDLSDALSKYGIKLIVYLPSGAPASDPKACKSLEWKKGPYPNKAFQKKWEQVIREWSLQWGKKIAGWWFDGCYWPSSMYRSEDSPNFKSFAAAARAGNPQSIVTFNPGVIYRTISITPYEDYIAGEIDHPERINIKYVDKGKVDGCQLHILSHLGTKWGMGSPRFTTQQIIDWSKQITTAGGAITWDTPVQEDGTISAPFMKQLRALGNAYYHSSN